MSIRVALKTNAVFIEREAHRSRFARDLCRLAARARGTLAELNSKQIRSESLPHFQPAFLGPQVEFKNFAEVMEPSPAQGYFSVSFAGERKVSGSLKTPVTQSNEVEYFKRYAEAWRKQKRISWLRIASIFGSSALCAVGMGIAWLTSNVLFLIPSGMVLLLGIGLVLTSLRAFSVNQRRRAIEKKLVDYYISNKLDPPENLKAIDSLVYKILNLSFLAKLASTMALQVDEFPQIIAKSKGIERWRLLAEESEVAINNARSDLRRVLDSCERVEKMYPGLSLTGPRNSIIKDLDRLNNMEREMRPAHEAIKILYKAIIGNRLSDAEKSRIRDYLKSIGHPEAVEEFDGVFGKPEK